MSVRIEIMTIPGAPLEGLNPLPMFHKKTPVKMNTAANFTEELKVDLGNRQKILPYKMQDRYSRKRLPMKMKTIVMENEALKAVFWPENGGRLYSLFDKVHNRELLMSNPVYQPGNLAIRNAWLSGGIEWNFGIYGHNTFTCDHLFAAVLKDENGEEFVRCYEFERGKSTLFQIDFHLPQGSPLLYSHVKLINPFDRDTTTYWWTNIAIPEDGNTRVLSSTDMVIVAIGGQGLSYEKLPELSCFPGKDLSYPHNATRGFDYFYQAPEGTKTAWEAGAYSDGLVFYDRSTAPLLYHKMFCWGNHAAGKHWQEYLSDPDKGYYVEIQGGIARSQMHDKLFRAGETIEWTQCFGGMVLDKDALHQESFEKANAYLGGYIDGVITEEELLLKNSRYEKLAQTPVTESDLVHCGSGWGALEAMRMKQENDGEFPQSVCFPASTIGPEQYPWYDLLTTGALPQEDPGVIPPSWMVATPWLQLLEKSIEAGNETWYSLLHYGVMLNEKMDESHVSSVASLWPEYPKYAELAKQALLRSLELTPSVWALRCLFCIEREAGNKEAAEAYYDRLFTMPAATVDFAFAAEYMTYLNKEGKYEKAWALYNSLPEEIRQKDRMMLCAAQTAIKVRAIDFIGTVFEREYADIREGESSLTDIWFEYCALKMAKERGLGTEPDEETLDRLMDEAWDSCPPPASIDFRMSYDRQKKYRMES